jgi:hypothetical protein
MIIIRKANKRGHANHGWLDTYHTFSFADYYDPAQMGFAVLRVINEDRIAGGMGFGTHPHQNMEIITYVIDGALAHKDSMGNEATINPGDVQHMSAGTGVRHSEFNPNKEIGTHLYQIWILPKKIGIKPQYGQKSFIESLEKNKFILVASQDGREGSVQVNQDLNMFIGKSKTAGEKKLAAVTSRHYWIQMVKGELKIDGKTLNASDGAGISQVKELNLMWGPESEFILFDMP